MAAQVLIFEIGKEIVKQVALDNNGLVPCSACGKSCHAFASTSYALLCKYCGVVCSECGLVRKNCSRKAKVSHVLIKKATKRVEKTECVIQ